MILGLTGGIASGKSTVSNIFKKYGIYIVDADKIAKELGNRKDVIDEIGEKISKTVIDKNGDVDRAKLKEIVFSDKSKLEILNKIYHPKIREEFKKIKLNSSKNDIIIFDVPLLFETGMYTLCDKNILVYVNEDIQIERLIARDGITKELAKKIIDSQMSLDEKKSKSNILIENNDSLEELEKKVEMVYKKILEEIR